MARFLQSKWCNQNNYEKHYEDKIKAPTFRPGKSRSGEGISVWIVPPFPYALQSLADESGQYPGKRHIFFRWIWTTRCIQLVQTIQGGRIGRASRKGRPWHKAIDELPGQGSCGECYPKASIEHQDCKSRMGGILRQRGERYYLQTFFKSIGARYKRIRKRPRGIPSPQLVDHKKEQLQELVNLWEKDYIDLRFGDESHICTSGYVPYGWHLADEEVFVASGDKHRLNLFGMISPNCLYDGFDTEDSITGEGLADFLDEFSLKISKPTVVVLDNASIHRKGMVAQKAESWMERGLFLFFLPPYCPHLNIAETLWRILKTKWIQPHHYCDKNTLHETTREVLAQIGNEYVINFAHAA